MPTTEAADARKADWRFLLPTGEQKRVLDVTDQRLARLLPSSSTDSGAPFDLVLGTDPQPQELEHAFASLRPGGVGYFEWRSWLRPSADSVRRRLEAAGFSDVRVYWSWPPEIPSVWVPLDAPSTARWVLRRRSAALAARTWAAANSAHLVRPRCATAMRAPLGDAVGPLGVPLGNVGLDPFWALLAPGSAPLNKVLAFVGAGGGDEPLFVLKMPRTQSAVKPLEREAAALRALHAAAPVDGVPKLLFEHREGDAMRAVAESPLRGRPLFELLDRRRHPALMRSSAEWLLKLAKVASSPRSEARSPAVDLATEAAAEAAPEDRDLILEAGRLASAADALPVVFEQRDFSPWNVHVGPDGGLVVFDWESAEPAGFPALDLIYLLAYCGFFLDGSLQSGRLRESYRATFEGGAAEESLDRYCRALGIDLAILPALHKLTWLVHLRSALRRDSAAEEADFFLELLREETSLPLRDVKPR